MLRLFKKKPITIQGGDKIVEAFKFKGVTYYQFEDPFKMASGRGLAALTIYEEFKMRCDLSYLEKHCRAIDILLSDPKKINIGAIAQIHNNLKERLSMAAFPNHIYKLASVLYFDQTEKPYQYDYDYNNKKIEKWKASGGTLDFFLLVPLKDLIPYLNMQDANASTFLHVLNEMDKLHRDDLQEILSKKI